MVLLESTISLQMKPRIINRWMAHKHSTIDYKKGKKRVEYNRIKRLEVYRYIRQADEEALIKYIETTFKPSPTVKSRYARFILGLNGKLTRFVRKFGQKSVRFVSVHELGHFLIEGIPVYSHKCFSVRYRKSLLIIRVYKVKTIESDNVKVEIGFYDERPRNRGPKDNDKKNCEKLAALQEIMNRIDEKFPLFPAEDYTPKAVRVPTIERRSRDYSLPSVKEAEKKKRKQEKDDKAFNWLPAMEKTYGEELGDGEQRELPL